MFLIVIFYWGHWWGNLKWMLLSLKGCSSLLCREGRRSRWCQGHPDGVRTSCDLGRTTRHQGGAELGGEGKADKSREYRGRGLPFLKSVSLDRWADTDFLSLNLAIWIVSSRLKVIPRESSCELKREGPLPRKSPCQLIGSPPFAGEVRGSECQSIGKHPSNKISKITTSCKGPVGGRPAPAHPASPSHFRLQWALAYGTWVWLTVKVQPWSKGHKELTIFNPWKTLRRVLEEEISQCCDLSS